MTTTAVDDYVEFCTFLRKLTGIDLSQYKRPQMERRLRSFYANKGIQSLTEPFDRLRNDPAHLDELLDRITINVSQLWRNPEQWDVIQSTLLPELAADRPDPRVERGIAPTAPRHTRSRRSATSSSRQARQRSRAPTSTSAWSRGHALGCSATTTRARHPAICSRSASTAIDGGWRAKLELRKMTRFDTGDLLQIQPRPAAYDLILCRNTVIYFSEPIRDELHARLASALRPAGYLVIGSTERVSSRRALGLDDETSIHLPEGLMDTSEYMPMFLAEAQEHLQELNIAVVALEERPRQPGHRRRDLPDRALAEGHERDDGLLGDRRAHACDGGRLRAPAPAGRRAQQGSDHDRPRLPGRAFRSPVDSIETTGRRTSTRRR